MQVSSISFSGNNSNISTKAISSPIYFKGIVEHDTVQLSKKELLKEEKLCKKIVKKLYGQDVLYVPDRFKTSLKRFDIRSKTLYKNIASGVFLYDKNGKFQYITLQENGETHFDVGEIKVFNKRGKLIKQLSPLQAKILRHYRGNLATNLNSLLRNGHENNPYYKDDIEALDSLFISKSIPSTIDTPTKVYRGVDINQYNFDFFKKNILKNNIMQEKGYMSTSSNKDIAHNNGNFIFEIDVPKGKKYLDMHTLLSPTEFYIDEQELLFNRGTNLLIKGFDNEKCIIYAQMI